MIHYRPIDTEVFTENIDYNPRTCFILTKLGDPIPPKVRKIKKSVLKQLTNHAFNNLDANYFVTGGDFLLKIWKIILSVPFGVAIITEELEQGTLCNIFYEVGLLNALGKHTIVVKSPELIIPSDFIRTEYIEYKRGFVKNFNKFLKTMESLPNYYDNISDQLEGANAISALDYLRRAYLISGDSNFQDKADNLLESIELDNNTEAFFKNFILHNKNTAKNNTPIKKSDQKTAKTKTITAF
jgi:hypothetical protein